MASYSAVAAKNIENFPSFYQSRQPSPVARKTTVRFSFDTIPFRKDFIDAVADLVVQDQIKCVQTLPGGRVDLTLRTEDSVDTILREGIYLDGELVKPRPLGVKLTSVYVHYLPSEMPNDFVEAILESFGRVIEVKRQMIQDTLIETGTRIVTMEVTNKIPSFVHVGSYRARIWHYGQIPTCGRCGGDNHFAKACPNVTSFRETLQREREDHTLHDNNGENTTPEARNEETEQQQQHEEQQPMTTQPSDDSPPQPELSELPTSDNEGESSSPEESDESDEDDNEDEQEDGSEPNTEDTTQATELPPETVPAGDAVLDPDLEKRAVKRALLSSPGKTKPKPKRQRSRKKPPTRK